MPLKQKTTTVDDYKLKLDYGARTNLFLIELSLPAFLTFPTEEENFRIMCQSVNMPKARTLGEIDVNVAGDHFKLPSDKEAEPDITVVFKNFQNHSLRNVFELWIDTIQQDFTSLRTTPVVFKAPQFFISQLDNTLNATKQVEVIGAFPKDISALEYNFADDGSVSETTVTFAVDGHSNAVL